MPRAAPNRNEELFYKMVSLILLIVGFALLVWGADKFVAGASALARRLGVSPLLVGLTIVAFGTSAPELAVSVTAAIQGANEIAVGNVVGSNIFNLLVVAGLSAVVCPLVMDRTLMRRDWPYSLMAAVVLCAMIAPDLTISRLEGIILLALFAMTLFFQIRAALRGRTGADDGENEVICARPSSRSISCSALRASSRAASLRSTVQPALRACSACPKRSSA